jgi:type II secretory pathway pseudopilin PulG
MRLRHAKAEEGFTMIMTVIGLALMAALVLVAVSAVSGDTHLTVRDLQQKQAYEAAKAGIDDYAYHLHANNSYWTSCANIEGATAVNQVNETKKRLTVPGGTGAEYAIELLPATTSKYAKCETNHATESMLQSLDPLKGTFRIRSNGYAGSSHASIVATFKPASFLDYVYFTQLETSDPVTYGSTKLIEAAEKQCSKTMREGRYLVEIESNKYCDVISFKTGDFINGPMHTNDAFAICGSPTLGGSAADPVEVSGPPPGWFSAGEIPNSNSSCSGSSKNFQGTLTANSAVLKPPPTNEELAGVAGAKYKGQVRICLSGKSMTVMTYSEANSCKSPSGIKYNGAIPANGVVYVESGPACSKEYSPFNTSYEITALNSECGNAYVEGTYTGQLTIGTYNDIIITGGLCLESCETKMPFKSEGVLGLVANNFVRVYHPEPYKMEVEKNKKGEVIKETKVYECKNGTGSITNETIDAAILAISHSFIVDNYSCGSELGTLTVNGAIAQNYRGVVGTTGGNGYVKSYNYDSRLKYIEPPSFIAPEKTAWVIGRETLE